MGAIALLIEHECGAHLISYWVCGMKSHCVAARNLDFALERVLVMRSTQ